VYFPLRISRSVSKLLCRSAKAYSICEGRTAKDYSEDVRLKITDFHLKQKAAPPESGQLEVAAVQEAIGGVPRHPVVQRAGLHRAVDRMLRPFPVPSNDLFVFQSDECLFGKGY